MCTGKHSPPDVIIPRWTNTLSIQHVLFCLATGTTPRPNTHTDYNGSSCWLSTGRAQLAQNGTFPGNQGLRDQESQVKILKLSLVAKLYYVTLESYQPYFLNVGSHSAEKWETQIAESAKIEDGRSYIM